MYDFNQLKLKKQAKEKIVMLTCYDAQMAQLLSKTPLDMILVGDSLGNVFQGKGTTAEVSVDEMAYHTKAVRNGKGSLPVVTDMPAASYISPKSAVKNARLLQSYGADAVKIEGYLPEVAKSIIEAGIPVMGHLGLLPQSAREFKVQGKNDLEAARIYRHAQELQREGCFAIVLECIPEHLAFRITRSLEIPTIGIGAGPATDGQILVVNDFLGLSQGHRPKFLPKKYVNLGETIRSLVTEFTEKVKSGQYPSDEESYH